MEQAAGRTLLDERLFDRLSARIASERPIGRDFAERIMDQTLAFLATAAAEHDGPLVPSPAVDIGWHTFILFTRDYRDFCSRLGRFVHHVPDDTPAGTQPGDDRDEAGRRTVDAIRRAGYAIDPELWGPSARCGNCHEDGNCSASGTDGNENTDTRTGR